MPTGRHTNGTLDAASRAGWCVVAWMAVACCTPSRVQAQHADAVLPIGTTIQVRLLDGVAGVQRTRGDRVRALVIAPVTIGGRLALSVRDTLTGTVRDAGVDTARGRQAFLSLDFTQLVTIDGARQPLHAVVAEVPNARESVDSSGRIVGPERPGTLRSRATWAATLLGTAHPLAAVVFFGAFRGEAIERHRRILYHAGTEMTVRLTDAVTLPSWPADIALPAATGDDIARLGDAPMRAMTARDSEPADVVTLALIGSGDAVQRAFRDAGWTSPERSSLKADIETLVKAAGAAGFARQPVSSLRLEGAPPAMVFEKVVNSMARRHHLRIWRWGSTPDGRPRWLVAASRDDGVLFSESRRSFGHRVDPAIDGERRKVIDDLITADAVARLSMLARPVPEQPAFVNGDTPVRTDWQLAVLVLR